ncbi:uncharacterized protein Nmlp_1783 [Natronomonas moolapensis 8.8.11]|uniref:Uncharacterized protein n=1 Tax=Natronomonas moolapensis (strain DSM 18674 / CECT 7526 / JCM 14361 / 8.8.11) TaxID=268739 RepID=M1Y0J2_NATM8|nr:hypothetical protein [Natronomonas moolapensis]CCQ35970.1 uncharacterized protein Nmlp_1783 [Natronomonas moolapensis 8.8.11]
MSEHIRSVHSEVDGLVRRYEYDDSAVFVADFGPVDGTVDVVDGTAMVVVDDDQYEFEVAEDVDHAIMNNGVVTIETEQ